MELKKKISIIIVVIVSLSLIFGVTFGVIYRFQKLEYAWEPNGGNGETTQPDPTDDPVDVDTTAPLISAKVDTVELSIDGYRPSICEDTVKEITIRVYDNNLYYGSIVSQGRVSIEISKKKDTSGTTTIVFSTNIVGDMIYDYTSETGHVTQITLDYVLTMEYGYRYMVDINAFDDVNNGRQTRQYLRYVVYPEINFSDYTLDEDEWELTLQVGFVDDVSIHFIETDIRLDNPEGDLYISLNMSIYDYGENKYEGDFVLMGLPEGEYYPTLEIVFSTVEPGGLVDIIDYRTMIANTDNEYYPAIQIEYSGYTPSNYSSSLDEGNKTIAYGVLFGSIGVGVVVIGGSFIIAMVRKRKR